MADGPLQDKEWRKRAEENQYGESSGTPCRDKECDILNPEKKDWISDMADGPQQEKEWRKRYHPDFPRAEENPVDDCKKGSLCGGECLDKKDKWRDLPKKDLKMSEIVRYGDCEGRTIEISGGIKNDKDKPNWWLLPLETIEGIVEVLTYGAKKYKPNNWQKVSIERNFAALLRHLSKWQAGEEFDPESGLHHLDHALCDLMFMAWKTKAR